MPSLPCGGRPSVPPLQSKGSVQLPLDSPEPCDVGAPVASAAALYAAEDVHAGVEAFLSKQPLPPFRGR
jgi:hypothetical protein